MVQLLDIDGQVSAVETKKSIAKISDDNNHYIKVHRGALVDPYGMDGNKVASSEYKKVTDKTYRLFSEYLQTKNSLKYLQAERSYREQESRIDSSSEVLRRRKFGSRCAETSCYTGSTSVDRQEIP